MSRALTTFLLIASLAWVPAARADLKKLDARARSALSRVLAGAPASALASAANAEGELDVFVVGEASRRQLEAAGARVRASAGAVHTAWIPASAVARVAGLAGVRRIEGAALVHPQLDVSIPAIGVDDARGPGPDFAGANGAGVLLGAVDSGVDYGHGDFDHPDGTTRLIGVWDQTDNGGPTPLAAGTASYAYGSDWSPAQLNAGTARAQDTQPHGTHVLGIAGGDGSQTGGAVPPYAYAGVAPRADLIMVDTRYTDTSVVDGVAYVFQRATQRGQNAVVNLSLGSQAGPHDGTSAFETALNQLSGPGRVVVVSAGNDRGRQMHAEILAAGSGTNATLQVSNSATGRAIAIDGYYESTENVSIRVTTPNGTVIGPVARGAASGPPSGQSTANGTVYVENGVASSPGGDPEVYIEIQAVSGGQNMNGVWTITAIPVALGAANGEVDLWRYYTNATAVFVQGNQVEELVIEPANADSVVTVAAYLTKTSWTDCGGRTVSDGNQPFGTLAGFSSPGPTRTGAPKPDITAPGVYIASTTSWDVSPSCGPADSYYLNDGLQHWVDAGTSMSAPHVAGAVALLMQRFGAVTPSFVKRYLADHALVDAATGAVWNKDWGHGKLRLDLSSTAVEPIAGWASDWGLSLRPNPALGPVQVEFALPRAGDVRVTVHDVQGRQVAELARGRYAAGRYHAAWSPSAVPGGLYWVRYRGGSFERSARVVVVR